MSARVETTERVETLIIGAGQAGLAAGYFLSELGFPFLILDANERVGDQWRRRYDSLRLFSPARWDGLPGKAFPGPGWSYPTGRQMGDYLESYAAWLRLPVRTGTRVDRLMRVEVGGDDFVAIAGESRIGARQVIVATGATTVPNVPGVAGRLDPAVRQLHSSEYRNPSQLADGPVRVGGLGHSGADIALELARTHRTILSGQPHGELPFRVFDTRWRARVFLPLLGFAESYVLTINTPIGRKAAARSRVVPAPLTRVRRADLARAGVERHASRVEGARDGLPVLEDGTVLDVANVVWCTGFGPDYTWIEPPVVGGDGWPIEQRGVSPVGGLYFLGVPFQYGVTSTLIDGAARDAEYVVDRIAERVRATIDGRTMQPATA
ncbi:MAG TPA: NAD(P)-binding domain-containing protein [Candidatus Limnocylindrales bacterium]|nr:NAD(P)-binding domain-containing protein [Candidatus Limnocylindrales bacterium]